MRPANISLKSECYPLMRDKVGNFLVYFCQGKEIPLSAALKLLYLLDETSVRESGVPITFLDYYVYERGPVAHDVYYIAKIEEKKIPLDDTIKLSSFIEVSKMPETENSKSHYIIKPKKKFDELECSEYELEILEKVVKKYGDKSANRLSKLTHEKNSLWDKARIANNLDEYFKLNNCKHSDVPVHFIPLMKTASKKRAYQNAKLSLDCISEF
jgi:uncharacterized phage-associated protein